jgi:hypothetical protein
MCGLGALVVRDTKSSLVVIVNSHYSELMKLRLVRCAYLALTNLEQTFPRDTIDHGH